MCPRIRLTDHGQPGRHYNTVKHPLKTGSLITKHRKYIILAANAIWIPCMIVSAFSDVNRQNKKSKTQRLQSFWLYLVSQGLSGVGAAAHYVLGTSQPSASEGVDPQVPLSSQTTSRDRRGSMRSCASVPRCLWLCGFQKATGNRDSYQCCRRLRRFSLRRWR